MLIYWETFINSSWSQDYKLRKFESIQTVEITKTAICYIGVRIIIMKYFEVGACKIISVYHENQP